MFKNGALVAVALVVTGCASQSANMRVGTDMSYASLNDQRQAARSVKILKERPADSEELGLVDASRCHRNTLEAQPTDEALISDLKVAAYARGADAIMDVKISKESGLLKNCWYIVTARGQALLLKQ